MGRSVSNDTEYSAANMTTVSTATESECSTDTGGTCAFQPCDGSRGPTDCVSSPYHVHNRCLCKQGHCAFEGRCVPKDKLDDAKKNARRALYDNCTQITGGTCRFLHCYRSRGWTTCTSDHK